MAEGVGKTILIVEDDTAQMTALFDAFGRAGFNVLQAQNGPKGLEIALERQPALIVLDNRMPDMSGYTMLRKLRKENSYGAGVPVIFFSNISISDDAEAEDILQTGPAYYLMKSETSLEQLIAKARSLIL